MRAWAWELLKWATALAVLAGLGVGAWLVNGRMRAEARSEADAVEAERRTQPGGIVKFSPDSVESHGIVDEPARTVVWRPRVTAYGRLVVNPRAAVELRAPFAGTLRAAPDGGWPSLGRRVRAGQTLARLEVRVAPMDLLDMRAKLADARARHEGADKVIKVLDERLRRLKPSPTAPPLAQSEYDEALVKLREAEAQAAGAKAAADQWQAALTALEHRGGPNDVWSVPLLAPADGEVTDLASGPGSAVAADAVLARVVDYRRALARLDVPAEALAVGPPESAELTALLPTAPALGSAEVPREDGPPVPAALLGVAGQVDAVSQLTACWYEAADAPPGWRPNLFVKALLPGAGQARDAVAVPRSAVLYHQGRALVYVCLSPGRYQRTGVQILGTDGDDYILARGVGDLVGERVVVRQAQVLLSEEFRGEADND
jgi:hypothetical protein